MMRARDRPSHPERHPWIKEKGAEPTLRGLAEVKSLTAALLDSMGDDEAVILTAESVPGDDCLFCGPYGILAACSDTPCILCHPQLLNDGGPVAFSFLMEGRSPVQSALYDGLATRKLSSTQSWY